MNIIKTSMIALIAILLSSSFLISCSKDEEKVEIQNLDLSDKVLNFDQIKLISLNIQNYQNEIQSKRKEGKKVEIDEIAYEREMQVLLEPLVENGQYLHTEMIDYLKVTGDYYELTIEDQNELMNLDEKQLAELSFVMSASYDMKISMNSTVRSCLSAAVGVGAIYDLMMNTAALGAAETTIAALRLIGRRYLGWIGVGLMVMDFADCYYGLF